MARITAFVASHALQRLDSSEAHQAAVLQLRMADEDFDVDMMLLETEEKMQKSIAACVSNLGH